MRRAKVTIVRPVREQGAWYAAGKYRDDLGDAYDRAVVMALREAFGWDSDRANDEILRDRLSSWLQWYDRTQQQQGATP